MDITLGDIMAHVVVKIGKSQIESVITRRSAEQLDARISGPPGPDDSDDPWHRFGTSAVLEALDLLPLPKATAAGNKRYFYSDTTGLRSLVKGAWRTMDAVFKLSGVKGAHPHRFRHTLASELLGKGGSIEKVAGILGDNPATISRYYAKWTPEYQQGQDDLIRKTHGTDLAQIEEQAARC